MLTELLITAAKLRELRQNERLSREALERRKAVKLRSLLRHVSLRSPYYQRLIAANDIDIESCEVSAFPVLTKAMLSEHIDEIVTDRRITRDGIVGFLRSHEREIGRLYLDEFHVLHSSGTSGGQSYAVYSKRDWATGMARSTFNSLQVDRDNRRYGGSRGRSRFRRVRTAFYGAIGGHFAGVSMMHGAGRGMSRLFVESRLFEINDPLADTVQALNAYRPDYLVGYTTALRSLAEQQMQGRLTLTLTGVTASGEVTTAADKEYLESAFGCEVRNLYACSELLTMGLSKRGDTAMVLYDDDAIYEFHEDHFLVTSLFNYTMPLIRYRIDDVLIEPRAVAGSPYLEVAGILGRTEKVVSFINEDGETEGLNGMSLPVFYEERVMRCQLQRLSNKRFRYLVWPRHDLPEDQHATLKEEVEAQLTRILKMKRLGNLTFEVALTQELRVDPMTRKFPLIVDLAPDSHQDGTAGYRLSRQNQD